MNTGVLIREARRRAGLTQRQLAQRAGTSHSTLAAYETGSKSPNVTTLDRLVRAAGFELLPQLRTTGPFTDRRARGEALDAVLELAESFPARHHRAIRYPKFAQR